MDDNRLGVKLEDTDTMEFILKTGWHVAVIHTHPPSPYCTTIMYGEAVTR